MLNNGRNALVGFVAAPTASVFAILVHFGMVTEVGSRRVMVSAMIIMVTTAHFIREGYYAFIVHISGKAILLSTLGAGRLAALVVFFQVKSVMLHRF